MRNTKYVSSGGVAFSESKDMKKLSKYAKNGWLLESFAPFGYKLRKGESKNIEYSLDYREEADDDYFAYFEEAGWSHVCSLGNQIHMFNAPSGTTPIYTDKLTTVEKYATEKKRMKKVALPTLIVTLMLFFLGMLSNYGWIPKIVGGAVVADSQTSCKKSLLFCLSLKQCTAKKLLERNFSFARSLFCKNKQLFCK